ncbi:hypothetical protein [Methylocaldum szegediense]|uniref:Yip1 domain-containing protein n=1 Tax=Methylocaldum szegediense TaxID=73780 RepID=A0ABN8X2E4_9GAMM|nr:hypothetical protein [Methylocaldum szegediense]CAI8831244.1 conserved membrane protein of unknown function [Methylocaldum szegediense]
MPLIKLFLDICFFRKGPQDTPASNLLLGLAISAYLIVGFVLLGLEGDWAGAVVEAIAEGAMVFGFLFVVLYLGKKLPRLRQTATALYGCDALISATAIPLLALLLMAPEAKPVYIFLTFLLLWHLAVVGHILRHALAIPFFYGVALAFGYVVISYQVMMALFDRAT